MRGIVKFMFNPLIATLAQSQISQLSAIEISLVAFLDVLTTS